MVHQKLSSSFRLTQADSRIRGNDRFFLLQNINRQWDLELSSIKTTQEMVLGIYFKSRPKIWTKLWKCQLWNLVNLITPNSLHFTHNDVTQSLDEWGDWLPTQWKIVLKTVKSSILKFYHPAVQSEQQNYRKLSSPEFVGKLCRNNKGYVWPWQR